MCTHVGIRMATYEMKISSRAEEVGRSQKGLAMGWEWGAQGQNGVEPHPLLSTQMVITASLLWVRGRVKSDPLREPHCLVRHAQELW